MLPHLCLQHPLLLLIPFNTQVSLSPLAVRVGALHRLLHRCKRLMHGHLFIIIHQQWLYWSHFYNRPLKLADLWQIQLWFVLLTLCHQLEPLLQLLDLIPLPLDDLYRSLNLLLEHLVLTDHEGNVLVDAVSQFVSLRDREVDARVFEDIV